MYSILCTVLLIFLGYSGLPLVFEWVFFFADLSLRYLYLLVVNSSLSRFFKFSFPQVMMSRATGSLKANVRQALVFRDWSLAESRKQPPDHLRSMLWERNITRLLSCIQANPIREVEPASVLKSQQSDSMTVLPCKYHDIWAAEIMWQINIFSLSL